MFPAARNPSFRSITMVAIFVTLLGGCSIHAFAQKLSPSKQKVILDTDIGDDIDDAYALALILSSPELQLMGVTTAWGDTSLRARLVERMLCETGQQSIPVFAGVPAKSKTPLTQAAWARRFSDTAVSEIGAVTWMAQMIQKNPGQITLIAIGPLSNVAALIDHDPQA